MTREEQWVVVQKRGSTMAKHVKIAYTRTRPARVLVTVRRPTWQEFINY